MRAAKTRRASGACYLIRSLECTCNSLFVPTAPWTFVRLTSQFSLPDAGYRPVQFGLPVDLVMATMGWRRLALWCGWGCLWQLPAGICGGFAGGLMRGAG